MEKTISKKTIYEGKIVTLELKDVLLENNKIAKREVIKHAPGVAIVATDGNVVYLVRQYRCAIEKEILEIPAGLANFGEDPIVTAHRELQEEIGYDAKNMEFLISFYPSPGFSDEVTYIYLGTELFKSSLPKDDDEFIKVETINVSEIDHFLQKNVTIDAKTALGLSLLKNKLKQS